MKKNRLTRKMQALLNKLKKHDKYNKDSVQKIINDSLCMDIIYSMEPISSKIWDLQIDKINTYVLPWGPNNERETEYPDDCYYLCMSTHTECTVSGSIFLYCFNDKLYFMISVYGIGGDYYERIAINEENLSSIYRCIRIPLFRNECINPFGLELIMANYEQDDLLPPQQVVCEHCQNSIEIHFSDETMKMADRFRRYLKMK